MSEGGLSGVSNGSQPLATIEGAEGAPVHPSQPLTGIPKHFGAPVVHGPSELLSVNQVAAILQVSRDAVLKLCEQGALPHIRISNEVCIAPAALGTFIAHQRSSRGWS
jgi:excisionase family DNA binding protein